MLSTSKEFVPEYFVNHPLYVNNSYSFDLIISSRNPKGVIRFGTTHAIFNDNGEVLLPQPWQTDIERMTIVQNGDVGIGNNKPKGRLHISNFGIVDDPNTEILETNGNLILNGGTWSGLKSNSAWMKVSSNPDVWGEGRIEANTCGGIYFAPGIASQPELSGGVTMYANKWGNAGTSIDGGLNLWLSYGKMELWHDTRGIQFKVTASSTANASWTYIKNRTLIGTEGCNLPGSGDITEPALTQPLMLAVNGAILCKELLVKLNGPWCDYVFADDYNLMPLEEVEAYIQENKHLPDIPSAAVVEKDGVNVGDMNALLLKKIEELTLYVIELKKENAKFQSLFNKHNITEE